MTLTMPTGLRTCATDDGRVFSFHPINHFWQERAYPTKVARAVLAAFSGSRPSTKHMCCHRDDDITNNVPENLYWGTQKENVADAYRNGYRYRIDDEDAQDIVAMYERGVGTVEICETYRIAVATIMRLVRERGVDLRGRRRRLV